MAVRVSDQISFFDDTLSVAKKHFRQMLEGGARIECKLCERLGQIWDIKIYSVMALALISLYKLSLDGEREFFHITEIRNQDRRLDSLFRGGLFTRLEFWDLICQMPKDPPELNKRTSGYWKITQKGRDFVESKIKVPKNVLLFDNKIYAWGADQVDIASTLTEKFDYFELIGRTQITTEEVRDDED